jgi:mono/diheme cytochrome c family protein
LKLFRLTALERSSSSEANAIELLESGFLLPLRLNAYTDFMSERKVRGILRVTGLTGAAAIILAGIWSALASTPTPPFIGADAFIDQNCAVCHSSPTGPGRLDLKNLSFEPANPDNFAVWVKVYDRVAAGEMPPAGMPQPAADARTQFVNGLDTALTSWEKKVAAERGRAGLRRLNNYEYENSIRDLLNVPWIQVRGKLPQDGESYRFNKTGSALDVSHVQLSRYMSTADYAMRAALAAKLVQPEAIITRIYARDETTLRNFRAREGNTRSDRLNFPVLDSHAQPDVRAGRSPISSPETREREAVGRVSSIFSDAGGFSWSSFRIPSAGRYKIRVKGYSIQVSGGGVDHWNYIGFGAEKAPYLYTPTYHRPNSDEVWPGRRNEPIGVYAQSSGQSRPLAKFDFTPEPTVNEVEVLLTPTEVIQTDCMRLFRTRVSGSEQEYVNPLAGPNGIPGVAFQWIEVEGPLNDPSTDAGYRLMFGDLPLRRVENGSGGVMIQLPAPASATPAGVGPGRRFGPRMQDVAVEVVSEHPQQDAERLLRSFVARAYRRPVEEAHVKRFLDLFNQQFALGHSFTKSLLSTYTAVLVSPGWLFVQESPGRLDDHALATRLALFLWNSEPDAELRSLAVAGRLRNPDVLKAQTARLLNNPKFARFVEGFSDYWLDLRKIDDSSPSTILYNDYELDDPLKLAAVEETRLFVKELFERNLPARNIIDSDFTFLNERLADHYGVPGVAGAKMRKVTLPKDSVRGGLLTQASVLKVTANGTTTSPVLRGVWIMERILGFHTAPPPGVPAIEPDIRGAVTIRQQLDKHRADSSCASCHRKIDPPGFALESFDVMGGQRNRYRASAEGVKPEPGIGFSGQPYSFHYGLPVDSSGTLLNGRTFKDIREFKKELVDHEMETVARNIASQLVIYATGAPVGFSDRRKIDEILVKTKRSRYGLRDIVHGIVESELFQFK